MVVRRTTDGQGLDGVGGWTGVDRSEVRFSSRVSALAAGGEVENSGKGRSGFGLGVGLR